jgi:acetolactate synthase-1/2/3 large subunit
MKMSDYIALFLAEQGIRHVFAITGGASIHMIHSIAQCDDIDYICPHHEQGASMAADAYARVSGGLGCAIVTSGPGATNLITGICGAWFDSVPVLYLTGQVTTDRLKGNTGVRQMGFQETEVIPMVRHVTKYAVQISDATQIRHELEKAAYMSREGRPGPVVVDIPDDLQRMDIDVEMLNGFTPPPQQAAAIDSGLSEKVEKCLPYLKNAQRPVIVVGWGVRLSGAGKAFMALAEKLGFPILPSWAAMDICHADHPLIVGSFGTHGSRYGNFAMQNADLVFSIGTRLDSHEVGPLDSWAREARTIIVDIDQGELDKFPARGRTIDVPIHADAGTFISALLDALDDGFSGQPLDAWWEKVRGWKEHYPACREDYYEETPVNPYVFFKALSKGVGEKENIFIDTGCTIPWIMQAFEFRPGQRLFHDFNNTAMGWALPAAIGGCFALDGEPVTCVVGDGSLMMNVQEMATVQKHRLPVRIIVVNNSGYSMVQQTQDQWLEGNYFATTEEGGLSFPDFTKLATAFGMPSVVIDSNADIADGLAKVYDTEGPVLCDVRVLREHRVIPQVHYGYPIEDSIPLLPREEFLANMIVEPVAEESDSGGDGVVGDADASDAPSPHPADHDVKAVPPVNSILVVGADGQVGSVAFRELTERGYEIMGTTRRSGEEVKDRLFLDLEQPPESWPELPKVDAAVISTAVMRVADCRNDPEGTALVNLHASVELARQLCERGTFVLFLSTTGVFDFTRPYRLRDEIPKPITVYGQQKKEAEARILEMDGRTAVLRLTKVLSPKMPLLKAWGDALDTGTEIEAYQDACIAPITPSFAARVISEIVSRQAEGIFHASGSEDLPYTVLAEQLAHAIGVDTSLVKAIKGTLPEYPYASAPRYTTLDMSREKEIFGISPPSSLETMAEVADLMAHLCRAA